MGTNPNPDELTGRPRSRPTFAPAHHVSEERQPAQSDWEMRCFSCGDPWSDDGPPCCLEPNGDVLRVVRRDGLATVYSHEGEVIAAQSVTLWPAPEIGPAPTPDREPGAGIEL